MPRPTSSPAVRPPLPAPPPTINLLNSSQRSRLLKSTRKLAEILGTTPHVVESDESNSSTPSSSPSSLQPPPSYGFGELREQLLPSPLRRIKSLSSKRRSESGGPPLVLRLYLPPPSPGSESDSGSEDGISQSPSRAGVPFSTKLTRTASHASNTIPMSHVGEEEDETTASSGSGSGPSKDKLNKKCTTKVRQKRMAKLTRVFGENVPADLISQTFEPSHHHHHHHSSEGSGTKSATPSATLSNAFSTLQRRRASTSFELTTTKCNARSRSPSPSPTRTSMPSLNTGSSRLSILPSFIPYILPTKHAKQKKHCKRHRRTMSASRSDSHIPLLSSDSPYTDLEPRRPSHSHHRSDPTPATCCLHHPVHSVTNSGPSEGSDLSSSPTPRCASNSDPCHVRPHGSLDECAGEVPGWNGEWNVKDAQERAMVLRNLKCR